MKFPVTRYEYKKTKKSQNFINNDNLKVNIHSQSPENRFSFPIPSLFQFYTAYFLWV